MKYYSPDKRTQYSMDMEEWKKEIETWELRYAHTPVQITPTEKIIAEWFETRIVIQQGMTHAAYYNWLKYKEEPTENTFFSIRYGKREFRFPAECEIPDTIPPKPTKLMKLNFFSKLWNKFF